MIDVEALRQLAADLDAKADVCDSDAQQAERIGGLDAGFRSGLAVAYRGAAVRIRHILTSGATDHQEGPAMGG